MTPAEQTTFALYVVAGLLLLVAAVAGHIPLGVASIALGVAYGLPLAAYGLVCTLGTWPH